MYFISLSLIISHEKFSQGKKPSLQIEKVGGAKDVFSTITALASRLRLKKSQCENGVQWDFTECAVPPRIPPTMTKGVIVSACSRKSKMAGV